MNTKALRLYAITDRSWLKEGITLAEEVEKAILGGATMVQLREKSLSGEALKKLAIEVLSICRKYEIPFIINDDVELAKAINADGVHVGQSDMSVSNARKILGNDAIIGATAKTIQQAIDAEKAGADYLGSGAIFGTSTKLDAKPMTSELLTDICNSVSIPVVAIGGIDITNIDRLSSIPIAGCAVVSGIFKSDNTFISSTMLRRKLDGSPVVHCITNHVTVNDVANMLLAYGASPIMSHHPSEVKEVQTMSDGLLINLGAIEDFDAMKIAYKTATELGHPIVIDPVGVSCNSFRRDCLSELLSIAAPSCIRGNHSEISAILADKSTSKGLDAKKSTSASEETEAKMLSKKLGCIICSSGKVDIIAKDDTIIKISSGSDMQRQITGSGCMLSACICASLCRSVTPSLAIVAKTCDYLGQAALQAANEIKANNLGTMSFRLRWIDEISKNLYI